MNRIKNTLVTTSLFCFMLVGAVFADDMKHHQTVTFDKAVMVNNTPLKKGTYRVTFDVQKSEVKFKDTADGDVVLVTPARVETMTKKAKDDAMTLSETAAGIILQKLVFEGHEEAAILNAENAESPVAHNEVPTNNNFSQQDWDWSYQQMNQAGIDSNRYSVNAVEPYEGTTDEETSDEEEMYCD